MFENFLKKLNKSPENPLEVGKSTVERRSNDPLEIGREVIVRRDSGARLLEYGWKITYFDKDLGKYIVQKPEPETDEVVSKRIPVKELEELNPPME